MPKSEQVKGGFASIAPRYDLANRFISWGTDLHWRAQVVRKVGRFVRSSAGGCGGG